MRSNAFLFLICLLGLLASCRTSKTTESEHHIQTDSSYIFSRNDTFSAAVQNVHDSVRITDSVRVVVDSVGKVIQEFHYRTEKETIIERSHDTIIFIRQDSAQYSSVMDDDKVRERVVYKSDKKMYVMIGLLALLLFGSIAREIKRKKNG